MILIGIVANKKCFETIKTKIEKKENQINVLHINTKSLENMKNIKFDTIIIQSDIEKCKGLKEQLKKVCEEAKYVIINTDLNENYEEFKIQNLITCGMNQNAMITVSSNSEDDILIYCQKSIRDKYGNEIEIEERRIEKEVEKNLKTDEFLVIYAILRLYNYPIIDKM